MVALFMKGCDDMPCIDFAVTTVRDVVIRTLEFLTDDTIWGANEAWKLVDIPTVSDFVDRCIIKGCGDGEDEIFIGIMVRQGGINGDIVGQTDIRFNGYAAYDDGLTWYEQPGCIYHRTLPIIPLPEGNRLQCWLTANTSRFILVIQESTQYESCYCGFMKPVAIERQYPYPLIIGGSGYDGVKWDGYGNTHSMWTNPGGSGIDTTLRLRRSDGTWEAGANKGASPTSGVLCVWPQNTQPTKVLTVLDNSLTVENVIMFPMMLYECGNGGTDPSGIVGMYDGVYFIGNREDISAKDTLVYKGKTYMVFSNVDRRDNDEYFAIEWF